MSAPLRSAVILFAAILGLASWRVLSAEGPTSTAPADIQLPSPAQAGGMSLTEALAKRRTVRAFSPQPVSAQQVAQLCWAAQGITEPQRGLRTAPSALAQYPMTVFVVDHTGVLE